MVGRRTEFLRHDATGLELQPGRRVSWRDVVSASVFKRDFITTDLVCLGFRLRGGGYVEVNEEMEGWESFLAALPDALPGFMPQAEWLSATTLPPFQANQRSVYERTE